MRWRAGRGLRGAHRRLCLAIETQLARWTTVLNAFQFVMMALAIGSAVALLYSAYLFVFNPLSRLQSGLARVGEGDLAARVEVGSSDEFGELSAGFNRMAQTLQGLYQNLEARCRKDAGPGTERARLAALYEAAAFVASRHHAGRAGAGLCAAGAARGARRCLGGALVRRIQPALPAAGVGLPAAARGRRRALCAHRRLLLRPAAGQAQTRVIPIRAGGDARMRGPL
jgi:two-component system nitrate/nitrite sensor histidine kinase NarX